MWVPFIGGEGSATHLKSYTDSQKSCETLESLLILKSKILNIFNDILYNYFWLQIHKSSITCANIFRVGHTLFYTTKTISIQGR